ncbi:MAG: hypothetical protein CL735_04235 [Chloroflexi bacterium]|nr:hypothetical protein [Chloroflexota bacterium]
MKLRIASYRLQILTATIYVFVIIFILGCSTNNDSKTSNISATTKTEIPVAEQKSIPHENISTKSEPSPTPQLKKVSSNPLKKTNVELPSTKTLKPNQTPKPKSTKLSKPTTEIIKPNTPIPLKTVTPINSEAAIKIAKSIDKETAVELAKSIDPKSASELAKSIDPNTAIELAKSLDPQVASELAKSIDPNTAIELAKSLDPQVTTELAKTFNTQNSNQTNEDLCKNPSNMMIMMMCMMMPPSQTSGINPAGQGVMNFPDPNEAPKLQNLLIANLGPWDTNDSSFGDLKYNQQFSKTVFDDFGMLHNKGQADQYDNPTFEFRAPADTILLAPVSGVVDMLNWQPSESYTQDDWDLVIKPSQGSMWGINIDHLVSIDCDRTGSTPVVCDSPLRVDGSIISKGSLIEAGQVLGYIGNWSDYDKTGINGRTELTVMKYFDDYSGVTNYCPTMYLDETIEQYFKSAVQELMDSYETWIGDSSIYNQEDMVAPGCRYSAITEINGLTQPITD